MKNDKLYLSEYCIFSQAYVSPFEDEIAYHSGL